MAGYSVFVTNLEDFACGDIGRAELYTGVVVLWTMEVGGRGSQYCESAGHIIE